MRTLFFCLVVLMLSDALHAQHLELFDLLGKNEAQLKQFIRENSLELVEGRNKGPLVLDDHVIANDCRYWFVIPNEPSEGVIQVSVATLNGRITMLMEDHDTESDGSVEINPRHADKTLLRIFIGNDVLPEKKQGPEATIFMALRKTSKYYAPNRMLMVMNCWPRRSECNEISITYTDDSYHYAKYWKDYKLDTRP